VTDLLKLLPHFSWRGNVYPVTSREVSFTHEGVRHKLQYRDGEVVEQTGAQALTFSYSIPMREDITIGPYSQLFSHGLPVLFKDILNRTVDVLIDPVYGQFNCFPTSYRDIAEAGKRDGVDLNVEFVRTLTIEELDTVPDVDSLSNIGAAATRLDDELKLTPGFEQFISQQGKTDFLSAIAGAVSQIQGNEAKVSASLQNFSSKLQKLDKALTKIEDPKNARIQDAVSNLRDSANSLAQHGNNPGQRLKTITLAYKQTIQSVAATAGMSLIDFLKLNPSLVRNPLVPKGSKIRIFG